MEIISRARNHGKTTDIIKAAAKNGEYNLIVCKDRDEVHRVWGVILEMHRNEEIEHKPPQPITFKEFVNGAYYGKGVASFLIDNADLLLQSFSNVPIKVVSFTTPPTKSK